MCVSESAQALKVAVYFAQKKVRAESVGVSSRHCHNSRLCDNTVNLCQINADVEYRNADAALDVLPWLTQLSSTTSVCVYSLVVCVCECARSRE